MADEFNVLGGEGKADEELDKFTKGIGFPLVEVNDQAGTITFGKVSTDSLQLSLSAVVEVEQGEFAWNADEETFDFGLNGAIWQGGLENFYHVRNDSGSTLTDGTPVMAVGTLGNSGRVLIDRMDGSNPANAKFMLGVVTYDIEDGADGKVTWFGKVRGIDTTGALSFDSLETWIDGDILYVDPVNVGYLTNVEPIRPFLLMPVAFVVHAFITGTIHVRITPINENLFGPLFGDVTNGDYSEFEDDGTLKFHGDATVWHDQLGPLIGSRLESPSSRIVQNDSEGSITFENNTTLVDFVTMPVQINHDWLLGSDVSPHIHWWQTSAATPNWLLQHRWQRNGEAKLTTWTDVAWTVSAFPYVSGILNQITTFGNITPPVGYGLSDVFQLRLLRDTLNDSTLFAGVDPEVANIDAMSFDVHVQLDTVGSREVFTK